MLNENIISNFLGIRSVLTDKIHETSKFIKIHLWNFIPHTSKFDIEPKIQSVMWYIKKAVNQSDLDWFTAFGEMLLQAFPIFFFWRAFISR